MQKLEIEIINGKIAPRYSISTVQLHAEKAIITEKGMVSNDPLVDITLKDDQGNKYFFMMSGNLLIMLASVIRGVMERDKIE